MTSKKFNTILEQTSFLHGMNSSFVDEIYLQYLKNPSAIPQSWVEFFDGLGEDKEIVKKEILGPTWGRKKNNITKQNFIEKNLVKDKQQPDIPKNKIVKTKSKPTAKKKTIKKEKK